MTRDEALLWADGAWMVPGPLRAALENGDFLAEQRAHVARAAADVDSVVSHTARGECGVLYSVSVSVPCDEGWSCTGCPHEYVVWERYVRFGTRDRELAGGYVFHVAATDQETIGACIRELCARAKGDARD